MKSNFLKYLILICIFCGAIYLIYNVYFKKEENPQDITEETTQEETTQNKEIRIGVSNYDTINPLMTTNKEILNITKLIFDPLILINENYEKELCLATECSKTSDTSYIVKVSNNVKWQDGTSLTSKDVQFTIDRIKESSSVYAYNLEKVTGVEIIDSETIKINLSEEVPFFEYNLTFPIFPNNYYLGQDFFTSEKTPIGTGMYKISSISASEIRLEKNERYWNMNNKTTKTDTIVIKLYSEIGEVYNAFKLGNIDIFSTSNTDLESYIGTIGYAKAEYEGRNFDYLAFNCENNILKDKEVRKAIAYCIDKTNIVSSVYNNQYYTTDFPLDYGSYLYTLDTTSLGYNQEQAKKVLNDAGWEYTNNRWQKKENYTTRRLSFTITVQSSNDKRVAVAENIKNQLSQIGIKITINKVSDAQYSKILENKNYEMLITGVYNSYSPNLEQFLGTDNLQNYSNQELETLLQEVKSVEDTTTMKEKYARIEEIYNDEMPFISLYRNKSTIIKSQRLAGEIVANNYYGYYNLYNWSRTE